MPSRAGLVGEMLQQVPSAALGAVEQAAGAEKLLFDIEKQRKESAFQNWKRMQEYDAYVKAKEYADRNKGAAKQLYNEFMASDEWSDYHGMMAAHDPELTSFEDLVGIYAEAYKKRQTDARREKFKKRVGEAPAGTTRQQFYKDVATPSIGDVDKADIEMAAKGFPEPRGADDRDSQRAWLERKKLREQQRKWLSDEKNRLRDKSAALQRLKNSLMKIGNKSPSIEEMLAMKGAATDAGIELPQDMGPDDKERFTLSISDQVDKLRDELGLYSKAMQIFQRKPKYDLDAAIAEAEGKVEEGEEEEYQKWTKLVQGYITGLDPSTAPDEMSVIREVEKYLDDHFAPTAVKVKIKAAIAAGDYGEQIRSKPSESFVPVIPKASPPKKPPLQSFLR